MVQTFTCTSTEAFEKQDVAEEVQFQLHCLICHVLEFVSKRCTVNEMIELHSLKLNSMLHPGESFKSKKYTNLEIYI